MSVIQREQQAEAENSASTAADQADDIGRLHPSDGSPDLTEGNALGNPPSAGFVGGQGFGAGGSDLGGVAGTGGGTGGGGGVTALGEAGTGAGTDLGGGTDSGSSVDMIALAENIRRQLEPES